MIEIKVVGLSHTHALRTALKRPSSRFDHPIDIVHMIKAVPGRDFIAGEQGKQRLHPALAARVAPPASAEMLVFSQIGGNVHSFIGLFEHPQPFDFVLPDRPDLPITPGAQIVPYGYMREVMQSQTANEMAILRALRDAVRDDVFHIESPPPVGDNVFCKDNLPPAFQTEHYRTMQIAPRSFRYKLWRLHSAVVREACIGLGIDFIACPERSMDKEGYLLPEFYVDPLHGNDLYGELVLDQISALVARRVRSKVAA